MGVPNILFILTDQHRHDYIGYSDRTPVETPHLDRLAARGMRFSQACTNSPICAPARIGLATGLAPFRIAPHANESCLSPDTPTYYRQLSEAGWQVGCAGKLDLTKGSERGAISLLGDRPILHQFGFNRPIELEGKWHSGFHDFAHGGYTAMLADEGWLQKYHEDYQERQNCGYPSNCWDSILPERLWQDAYTADRAIDWLRAVDPSRPWHLFVSFAGPHDPFDPPSRFARKYRDREMPTPIPAKYSEEPAWLEAFRASASAEETRVARAQYCASIEAIDDQIGRILAVLEERGELEDTLIVFSSDHGESLGDRGHWEKQTPYEGSIRVPLFVCGPGIQEGECNEPVELIDLAPTLCELAGVAAPAGLDARPFANILRTGEGRHRDSVLITLPNFQCVRTSEWKYVRHVEGEEEFFDLKEDPNELRNLAEADLDRVRTGRELLDSRLCELA